MQPDPGHVAAYIFQLVCISSSCLPPLLLAAVVIAAVAAAYAGIPAKALHCNGSCALQHYAMQQLATGSGSASCWCCHLLLGARWLHRWLCVHHGRHRVFEPPAAIVSWRPTPQWHVNLASAIAKVLPPYASLFEEATIQGSCFQGTCHGIGQGLEHYQTSMWLTSMWRVSQYV